MRNKEASKGKILNKSNTYKVRNETVLITQSHRDIHLNLGLLKIIK